MGATAEITISATVSGLAEGGVDQLSMTFTHSSAANTVSLVSLTTVQATASAVVVPTSGQFILAFPAASTNTNQWVVTPDTAQAGMTMSSNGFFAARAPGGSSFKFYTVAGGTTFTLRVLTF